MNKKTTHHKTIVISDVHLGSKWSKAKQVTDFLTQHTCETLILCGDIIDGWLIMRGRRKKWSEVHTNFFRQIAKIADNTKIYYLKGNHDDFIDRIMPFSFHNVSILKDLVYESLDKKYYVFHGDALDNITSGYKWLAKMGDLSYNALLHLNKPINAFRKKRGLPYYSFSAAAKQRTKNSVSKMSGLDKGIKDLVKQNGCTAAICGHTHSPEIRQIDDILYLNSGDWLESLSALSEDFEGNWQLHYYPFPE